MGALVVVQLWHGTPLSHIRHRCPAIGRAEPLPAQPETGVSQIAHPRI